MAQFFKIYIRDNASLVWQFFCLFVFKAQMYYGIVCTLNGFESKF